MEQKTPEWLGSLEGLSEAVLPPWTPLVVSKDGRPGGGVSVACWGRTYHFVGPFPEAIEAAGAPLLAKPIRVLARVGGRDVEWSAEGIRVMGETPARVTIASRLADANLTLTAETALEYDGMVRVDWRLEARRPVVLESLTFEIRVPTDRARYLYYFPGKWGQTYNTAGWGPGYNARPFPEEPLAACFRPYIWLGDDDRGLSWFCESDENWLAKDPDRVVEVRREGDEAVLRITLVSDPIHLDRAERGSAGGPARRSLNYTFGIQATPVRPNPEDVWDWRLCHGGDYGIETLAPDAPCTLRYPAEGNFDLSRGTVELWIKPCFDAGSPEEEHTLFSLQLPKGDEIRWYWPAGEDGMRLVVRQQQDRVVDLKMDLDWSDQWCLATEAGVAWTGDWHHMAFTWGDAVRVFHDGRLVAQAARTGTFVGSTAGGTLVFGGPGDHLLVDEIRISSTARTLEEMAHAAVGAQPPAADEYTLLLDHLDQAIEPGSIEHLDGGYGGYASTLPEKAAGNWGWHGKPGGIIGLGRFRAGKFGNALELGLDRPPLEYLAELGVRTLCIHEQWTDWEGYPGTTHGENLRSLVDACHERGIKLLVYLGFLFPDLAPEWPDWGDQCVVEPRKAYDPYDYPPQPHQKAYFVCYQSAWQDRLAHGIAQLMDEYDVDGVYLDGTSTPWACSNEHHGCGYTRLDGSRAATYPIFAVRDVMRRIYTVVKGRKPDGHVNVHQSTCMTIPTLAWATSYWDGEQFGSIEPGPFALETISLATFRAEFMGHQWGVPAEYLCYDRPYTYEQACAFTLPHDVLVRANGLGPHLELESKLWEVADAFGRKEAEWLPYWRNGEYVSVAPDGAIASLYRHPGGDVLLVVSNLGREPAPVSVRLDTKRLGLPASVEARDALTGLPVALLAGAVSLELGSLEWRLLWLASRERAGWMLSDEAFDEMMASVENPPEPTRALVELMRGAPACSGPG